MWVAASAAGGAEWRQFHRDVAHTGSNPDETMLGVGSAADLELKWSADTGGGVSTSGPSIANGRVFIATHGSSDGLSVGLSAFDQTSGDLLWRQFVEGFVDSSPVVVGGKVFILTNDRAVVAYRSWDGKELWSVRTGGVLAGPVVRDGIVYVGGDRRVFALEATTGATVWSAEAPVMRSPPTLVGSRVYIAGQDRVVAYRVATGAVIWTKRISEVGYSSPVVVGSRIYVGTAYDGVYSLFAHRGTIAWHSAGDRGWTTHRLWMASGCTSATTEDPAAVGSSRTTPLPGRSPGRRRAVAPLGALASRTVWCGQQAWTRSCTASTRRREGSW